MNKLKLRFLRRLEEWLWKIRNSISDKIVDIEFEMQGIPKEQESEQWINYPFR